MPFEKASPSSDPKRGSTGRICSPPGQRQASSGGLRPSSRMAGGGSIGAHGRLIRCRAGAEHSVGAGATREPPLNVPRCQLARPMCARVMSWARGAGRRGASCPRPVPGATLGFRPARHASVEPVLRPELIVVGEALLAIEGEKLSLDQVAEAIGTARVTPDEIDELIYWLEMHGRPIADPIGKGAAALLGEVLAVARTLRAELGRSPQPREIAERGGLSLEAVQRALWFARILQR